MQKKAQITNNISRSIESIFGTSFGTSSNKNRAIIFLLQKIFLIVQNVCFINPAAKWVNNFGYSNAN